ncbi:MAG TPA: aspartate-semialdehyde dehydrogenase [Thermoanaerobaculia bacterium]|nr:aspartate-semialdehyde dehydrogenase [Thermoanaerobaculia bacterium]
MESTTRQRERIPAAVLGATGAVGQRFVALLADHPWFELAELAASDRSAGRPYGEAVHWLGRSEMPESAAARQVVRAGDPLTSPVVFSALGRDVASELEPLYASQGHRVVSNASSFRTHPQVPLLIPEINPDSLDLLPGQEWAAAGGCLVTNPNCSTVGLTMALAPLHRELGVEAVTVATMQALSGAGYPGVSALDALGNVIPYIPGEEEKIEREPLEILGADFPISAAAHRVPVIDGHTQAVFVRLARRVTPGEAAELLASFVGEPQRLRLPSAPQQPIGVLAAPDRPQPLHDVDRRGGMTVWVGRLRGDRTWDLRFTVLVHNTLRGAAGAAVLNAELMLARGLIAGSVLAGAEEAR